jgi:steroid 5-alpha reductase family enzyme
MFNLEIYAGGLSVALILAVLLWLVSVPTRRLVFVDALWPILILAMTLAYVHWSLQPADRAYLVLFLVTVWAVRLSTFVISRSRWLPEDRRYRTIGGDHPRGPGFAARGLYMVFGLQAIVAWIISLPLLGAALGGAPLGWLDGLAVALWLAGFLIEAVSDQRLTVFRADPSNHRRVLDQGLWRWSRHPNYFGEACLWWGYGLLALAAGAWWGLLGPAVHTLLLARVSGIPRLEAGMSDRRPGYADYSRRTNAFIPGPRRRPVATP